MDIKLFKIKIMKQQIDSIEKIIECVKNDNIPENQMDAYQNQKAIEYLEKALKSDLKTFGEKHSNVATYRNNLGTALNSKGEYDKAIEHLEKALSVIQVRLGNDHPDTKTLKTNLRLAKEEKPK